MNDLLANVSVPVIFALVIGGIILGILFNYRKNKARREAIQKFATSGGHTYIKDAPDRVGYFRSPPFGTGLRPRATDVVYGEIDGQPFETFAYLYQTESRDSKGNRTVHNHPFQVTWVPLPASLSTVRISADNAFLRAARKLGGRNLDTESNEFNKRWRVWCDEDRVGHALLAPRMIELFLRPELDGRGFVFEGKAVMTFAPKHTDLSETPGVVALLKDIVSLVPPFLIEEGRRP